MPSKSSMTNKLNLPLKYFCKKKDQNIFKITNVALESYTKVLIRSHQNSSPLPVANLLPI